MDHIGFRLQAFKGMSNNLLSNGIVSVVILIVGKVLSQIEKKRCPALISPFYRAYPQHLMKISAVAGIVSLMANLAAFAAACKTVKVMGLSLNKPSFINISKIFNIIASLALGLYILVDYYRASVTARSIKEALQNSKFERIKTSLYSPTGEKIETTILVNPKEEILLIKTPDGKDFERNIKGKLVFLHVGSEDVIQGFVKYLREHEILSENDRVSLLHRSNQDDEVIVADGGHAYLENLQFEDLKSTTLNKAYIFDNPQHRITYAVAIEMKDTKVVASNIFGPLDAKQCVYVIEDSDYNLDNLANQLQFDKSDIGIKIVGKNTTDVQIFSVVPRQPKLEESVHKYPGDLTPAELASIKGDLNPDQTQFNIKFTSSTAINVSIRRQDMFEAKADVIVNAANTYLGGGGGIDGLTHEKGGDAYKRAHQDLKKLYPNGFVSGYAAMIASGDLKKRDITNVIVVAGPQGPETNPEKEDQLYSCYLNSLILAYKEKKKHIALPSISTGIYNFPKNKAAAISLRAIYDFAKQNPQSSLKISIHFLPKAKYENSVEFYAKALTV